MSKLYHADNTLSAMAVCSALVSSFSTLLASFHGHETITQTARLMLIMALLAGGLYWLLYKRYTKR